MGAVAPGTAVQPPVTVELSWSVPLGQEISISAPTFATVMVTYVELSNGPVFAQSDYSVVIPENAAVDSPVITLTATLGSSPGPIVYTWAITDSHFALNSSTGVITVAQPLNFAAASTYLLQVRAYDSISQFQACTVHVNITYVPKPPADSVPPTVRSRFNGDTRGACRQRSVCSRTWRQVAPAPHTTVRRSRSGAATSQWCRMSTLTLPLATACPL